MKKIISKMFVFAVVLTIMPTLVQSQGFSNRNTRARFLNDIRINDDNSIIGSPYVNDKFVPARVTINDEEKIYNIRYNAYLDIIELEDENKQTFTINKSVENLTITLLDSGDVLELVKYLEEYTIKESYFLNLSPSTHNVKLFKKSNVKLIPAKASFNGYDKARKATYAKASDEYYIKVGEDLAVLAPRKKKDIAKLLPEHKSEILKFVKENKIKTSREEDLKELVDYLNLLTM